MSTVALATANPTQSKRNSICTTSGIFINASKEAVMNALRHYEEFPNWSPFIISDPEQKYTIGGVNGKVGSTFSWEGVAEKSLGTQTIAEINGNDYIRMDCDVKEPFKAQSVFEYTLEEKNGGVEVKQDFITRMGAFSCFMAKLFGAKKEIQKLNDLGLERLKTYVENK